MLTAGESGQASEGRFARTPRRPNPDTEGTDLERRRAEMVSMLGPFSGHDSGPIFWARFRARVIKTTRGGPNSRPAWRPQFWAQFGVLWAPSCLGPRPLPSPQLPALLCAPLRTARSLRRLQAEARKASGVQPWAHVAGPSAACALARTMRDACWDPFSRTALWAMFRGRMFRLARGARLLEMFASSRSSHPAVGPIRADDMTALMASRIRARGAR